jgi:hypothetical protein
MAGGEATTASEQFLVFTDSAVTQQGANLTITNNIGPAGEYFLNVGNGVYYLLPALQSYFSSFTVDRNAITDLAAAGYSCSNSNGMNFPSPVSNYCDQPEGQPATMASMDFVNYDSGIGGDYHLCHGNGIPSSSCTAASAYANSALDGTDVGANISTVNSYTAGVVQGTPTQP